MKIAKLVGGAAAVSGLLALALTGAGTAHADTNPGSTSTLAMVGSDTTQDVMEGLSGVIKDAANAPLLSNYKSTTVGRTISTRTGNANCSFTVPKNSGEGRDALSAALRGASFAGSPATGGTAVTSPNMTGCVNVARSSSGGNPTTSPGVGTMTYVPFGTDSVTYATQASSSVPHTLNKADLVAIYTANSGACILEPLLPAAGSGTRSFWATALGLTDAFGVTGGWGSCVKDVTASGTSIQEHDGRFLTNGNQLVPISTAQFVAQQAGVIADIRGNASLGSIDFDGAGGANAISPVVLQQTFGTNTRPVYNVISTAAITSGNAAFNQKVVDVFVGTTSKVCANSVTIQQYGLAPIATCGDTSKKNTN